VAGFNQGFFSVMFYANSLASVVPGIVGYAFSVASFPTLSRLYTHKQYAEMNEIVIKSVNQIVFLALPIVMATMVLRLPIVRLVYGLIPGTSFDRLSTLMVAWALLFFAMGIIFYSTKWYLYRLFYVAQNTVLPLALSVLSLVLTIGLTFLFTNLFSHAHTFSFGSVVVNIGNLTTRGSSLAAVGGAALALSTVAAVEFFVLLWLVNKVVIRIDFKDLFIRVLRKLIPAVISGALMYAMYRTWDIFSFPIDAQPGFVGSTTFNLFILTSLTVFTSFMVYYLLCYLFDVEELKILRRILNPLFKLGGLRIE
jgi:putative peptidoglycan lipid II flippase